MSAWRRSIVRRQTRSRTGTRGWALRAATLVGVLAAASTPAAFPAARAQEPGSCPDNLLANGGFEHGFGSRGRMGEIVADHWTAWYERFPGTDGINYVPYYAPVDRDEAPFAVADGLWSQEWGTEDATHTAGVWQRIAVPAGTIVSSGALAYAWASDGDDPRRSEPPGTYVLALGLDGTGGTDPNAPTVVWTSPITVTDIWIPLALELPATGDAVTVYLRGQPLRPMRHNVSRWDAVCLRAVGVVGTPSPSPTAPPWPSRTPLPGTPTEAPTASPTADSATQTALDVALFLDHAATSEAARAGGDEALGVPEDDTQAGALPDPQSPLADGLDTPGRWEALRASVMDRAGLLVLGVAALIGGALLGSRWSRPGAGPTGGDREERDGGDA